MTFKLRLRARNWLFILVGLALTGTEVYGSVEYLMGRHGGHWSYIVFLGATVTAASALIPLLVEKCLADGRYLAALACALMTIPALSTIFLAAVERTGGARDTVVTSQRQAAVKIAAAERAEAAAQRRSDADDAAVRAACAPGRWQGCIAAEERAKQSRLELSNMRQKRVDAGDLPLDPQARRISAMTGLSEATIQLWEPLILPITGSLLGIMFLSVGGKIENNPAPVPPPAEQPPVLEPTAGPAKQTLGSVPRFILQCMPAEAGSKAEIEEIYGRYVEWCRRGDMATASKQAFAAEFVAACRKTGIGLKSAGRKVYCLDRRLSA